MSGMFKFTDDIEQWIAEAVNLDGTVLRLGNADSREAMVKSLAERFEAEKRADFTLIFPRVFDRNKLDYIRVYLFEDRYIPTEWCDENE